MKKIFLITKLKTSNIGNEALSHEIISLFHEKLENCSINVNGRPSSLDGYQASILAKSDNPLQLFEKWSDEIVNKLKKEKEVEFKPNKGKVILLSDASDFKTDQWKAWLRPIKRWFNSKLIYSKSYEERAKMLKASDWIIYSGAGEVNDGNGSTNINDGNVFLRQLIEIRVAQKLGIKSAAINQSVNLKTTLFQSICAHVYGKMEKIIIRGNTTRENLINYGIPSSIIEVAPDSAINTKIDDSVKLKKNKNKVGFNISDKVKITDEEISRIITHLQSLGKEVVYCTNEPYGDMEIINKLEKKFNISNLGGNRSYKEYAAALAECDFVISARVHTNMLTLVSHTPIIPIEGSDFRLAELLEGFKYPIPISRSRDEGWVDQLLSEIDNLVVNNKYDFENYFTSVFDPCKKTSHRNATWLNDIK